MQQVATPTEIADLIDREAERVRAPGTWFTGRQRTHIAEAARGERDPDTPAEIAARRIHDAPADIRRDWLAELEAGGLTLAEYVEVLGIVARLRAFDTFCFGVGRDSFELREPLDGAPARTTVDDVEFEGAWVPTVGVAFPPSILSSVPAENEAMHDAHGILYLAPSGEPEGYTMGNMHVVRDGLTRSQIEFVAARTSLLNDCFF